MFDTVTLLKEIEYLKKENERLKAGDFTPEEIQNFCHKLNDTVPRQQFEEGCNEYQNRLYGVKK